MKFNFKVFLLFLLFNFGGLAIGAYLQGSIPDNEWYSGLNKAPWTPPGWVFGAAWTLIMILYSVYMPILISSRNSRVISLVFTFSWIFNVLWNPLFFRLNNVGGGLIVLCLLSLCIYFLFINYWKTMRGKSLLLLPYMLWLLIAISLNGYVFLNN